jgi:hypothetical protein
MLLRLELRHAKQVAEKFQPVAVGKFAEIGNGLRDEGHSLVWAALPNGFYRGRSPIPA